MAMPPLNLNLLRSLELLLETRNLTQAALQLGLTQSALSRHLVQLREQLNDPLLVRQGQQYLLTERAQALREPLKLMLAGMDALLKAPSFEPATCRLEFSISGSDYIADLLLPVLMKALLEQAPHAKLMFRAWGPGLGQYRQLLDGEVDLVPTLADAPPDNLHGRAMGEDRPVCLMRASHALAGKPGLSLADYCRAQHLEISGGGDKSGVVEQALAGLGARRELRLSVPFYGSALQLLREQDLLLTIPEHIALAFASRAPLVWRTLPFEVPSYRYWLLWHPRSHHDAAHQWFRNMVHGVLHGAVQGITHFNLETPRDQRA